MGAWIEIITSSFGILRAHGSLPSWERGLKCYDRHQYPPLSWSLPSWERGLKFEIDKICIRIELVAPLVGAWIEIVLSKGESSPGEVAPLVGAWIEIFFDVNIVVFDLVAPLVGAWIEIPSAFERNTDNMSRSPRGSVD